MALLALFWLHFLASADIDKSTPSVQNPVCLPANAPADWPVAAIYLHGMFPKDGYPDGNGFRDLEARNRARLAQLAESLHIRIAVPVSPRLSSNGSRIWIDKTRAGDTGTDLKDVEAAARRACGGKPLAPDRKMIGFSNGGYQAAEYTKRCPSGYSRIWSIGAVNSATGNTCPPGVFKIKVEHALPGLPELEAGLSGGGLPPPAPAVTTKPKGLRPAPPPKSFEDIFDLDGSDAGK